ncbi:uncharacterized protein LOC120359142 [Solenopsis invicta]|uniref:uncharacterized protein LOC120359142 n=1 Tax=Solenopsis invicta TaxID=13686 RepID=UPI00193D4CD6|nr:uncharacterized protein LOC120359142 [Solenopsis invicta]
MRPTRNVQPSQETLHEVRRRLRSLHNMLQTYQDTSRSPEKQTSMDRIDKIDPFITYPVVNISSEYFDLDRSEESLSSLAEYSSRTSKTYRRDSSENVTLRDTCSNGFRRTSVKNDLTAFATTESHLHSRKAMLQTSESNEDECKASACDFNIFNRSYNRESNLQTDKDAMKTDANTLINIQNNISEAVSERIFYILSPENKDIQTQNETSLKNRFDKFSNAFDKEYDCEYQENTTISQNSSQSEMSNISREDKSTALLLQEALHFKNVLLTHSRKKYPTNDMKQSDVADKFSPGLNNFPSMIIDVKDEEPIIGYSHDKTNQRYICLEMKQRHDLFPQSSKKANTFARKDERDTESQNCIPEISSEYFSITNLAMQNSAAKIENNVSLKPPVYEKVISIAIPIDKVNVKSSDKINTNESPMKTKTVLRNIQTRVNLRENAASDIDDIIANKRSPRILKLEDLILERVKNIRDYMDTFLQNQNTAIFKARRALQCRDKSDDIFRCSDKASHVVIYNRSIASSSRNSTDKISSKKSLDFLIDTWPNHIQKYKQEMDDVLNCSSDVYLKRNPGIFALTPIKNKITDKNDPQQSKVATELEREDLSLPKALTHSCKNYSKSTHRITNLITPRCEKHHIASNVENGKIDKGTTVDVNDDADFHKRRRQAQIAESKPSTISYFPLDANADAKIIHIARKEYLTKSNCNSISHSNSYFTDEEIISDVRMDDVSSETTSNVKHSHQAKSNVQKEIKQNVIKRQISVDECPDTNVAMPSKLSSDNEYSNLTIIIDSNLILDKSECNHSTKAKTASPLTMLKENNFIFDPEASIPLSLEKEDKTLNTKGISVNNLKQNDEISVNTVHSPQKKRYSIKPLQISKIKAKSDMSLITNRSKNLKINLVPKKSHSFLMRHNTMEFISGILHQPCAKLHNDKNKCIKNKLRLTTQSKSVLLPRKISTKSCIPILKNCVESSHRMKHQAQTRSPMKSPLTMLCGEKTCTKDHEEVARSDNGSINKHLRVEEAVSDLNELNIEKGILNKELEKSNVACRNISKKNSGITFSENVKSLAIDKEHSDEKDTYDNYKSDTSLIQHIEKIASKEVVVISIMANDSLRKKYPADLFILNSKNISPAADLLIHKNKLWTITIGKTEKEVTAKPSITDTCTSMPDLQ